MYPLIYLLEQYRESLCSAIPIAPCTVKGDINASAMSSLEALI